MATIRVDASEGIKFFDNIIKKSPILLVKEWEEVTLRTYIKTQDAVHVRTGKLKASGEHHVAGMGGFAIGKIDYSATNRTGGDYAEHELMGGGYLRDVDSQWQYETMPLKMLRGAEHTEMQGLWNPHDYMSEAMLWSKPRYYKAMVDAMKKAN